MVSPEASKYWSSESIDDTARFGVKYRKGNKNDSTKETPKRKVQGKKRKQVVSSSPYEDKDVQDSIEITKATPHRLTRSMT